MSGARPAGSAAPGEIDAHDPDAIRRHAPWLTRLVHGWFRADVRGLERVPDAPFVGVGNHSGAAMIPDTLVWLGAYYGAGRQTPLLTLAHDAMFDVYPAPLARALARMGALRAGAGRARAALERGYAVQVYPGGDRDACRPFWRRHDIVFAGRTGYVTLARDAGVPIVPVVSVGAHEALLILWDGAPLVRRLGLGKAQRLAAFPVSVSIPWGLWVGPVPGYVPLPTKVQIEVLAPVDARAGSVDEVDRRVRASMQAAATRMAARRRLPVIG